MSGIAPKKAPLGARTEKVLAIGRIGAYVELRCTDSGPLPSPGQFYMVRTANEWGGGQDGRPYLARAFSYLHASAGELSFLLEDVGPGTHRLSSLTADDELELVGPLGNTFSATQSPSILVGGGIGVAPIAAFAASLAEPAEAKVVLGFRDADRAKASGLFESPVVCTDDGSVGHHGFVTEPLREILNAAPGVELVACGPPAMLEAVRQLADEFGSPSQLALEAPMACGYGACYGCVVETQAGYKRVCVDGPVFAGAELAANSLAGHPA